MTNLLSGVFFVFIGYILLSMFMYYLSFFGYYVGYGFQFITYPLNLITSFLYPVGAWVYVVYSSLIFFLLYKLFKSVFINKK